MIFFFNLLALNLQNLFEKILVDTQNIYDKKSSILDCNFFKYAYKDINKYTK